MPRSLRSYLVSQDGNMWPGSTWPMLAERFGIGPGQPFFSDYAVTNLGFVRIDSRGKAAIVKLHPARVSPQAFAYLMQWMVEKSLDRVLFCDPRAEAASNALYGDKNEAFREITRIVSTCERDGRGVGDILFRPVSANTLPAEDPMRQMLYVWHATNGRWNKAALIPVIRQFLSDRFIIFEHTDSGNFLFREFGESLPGFASAWLKEQGAGRPVQHQPDREYGWSCALTYERVLNRFAPDLHDVDAFVNWPGTGRVRRRYKRLLLPFSTKTGKSYVLSATAEDRSIDLRAVATAH